MRLSKHHYAETLARRGNTVFFLEPPRGRWQARPRLRATDAATGVTVVAPGIAAPLVARYKAAGLYDALLRNYLRRVLAVIGGPPDIVWCFDSNTYPDLGWFGAGLRVYHPVDFVAGPAAPRLAATADAIFSVAPEILAQFGGASAPRAVIPHGLGDAFARRARTRAVTAPAHVGTLRVGYVGNLFHAGVDHLALHATLDAHPDVEFHFWSPARFRESTVSGSDSREGQESVSVLRARANVVFHNPARPDELAGELERMDLLLLCYDTRRDPNGGVNSHKVLEYLSTGRVVVANRISAYVGLSDLVRMPDSEDNQRLPALVGETLRSLEFFNSPDLQRHRTEFALDNTYERQLERIERLLPRIAGCSSPDSRFSSSWPKILEESPSGLRDLRTPTAPGEAGTTRIHALRGRVLVLHFGQAELVPPLMHAARVLAMRGWSVRVLSLDDPAYHRLRASDEPNLAFETLPSATPGIRQKLLYLRFTARALRATVRSRPAWLYVSNPLAAPAGLVASWLSRRRVLYQEHDAPGAVAGLFMRICGRARARLVRKAHTVAVPTGGRTALLPSRDPGRPAQIAWNCPRREEVLGPRPAIDRPLRLIYQGSLGPDRLPLSVLHALAQVPGAALRIVSYRTLQSDEYARRLADEARRLEVVLEFSPAVPRPALFKICQEHDVGVALLPLRATDPNAASAAGASNKAFDYLACGLPLLVSALPDWEELFVRPGYGLACDPADATSIARALHWFADHPRETAAMGERGRVRIRNEWNFEMQFAHVLASMGA